MTFQETNESMEKSLGDVLISSHCKNGKSGKGKGKDAFNGCKGCKDAIPKPAAALDYLSSCKAAWPSLESLKFASLQWSYKGSAERSEQVQSEKEPGTQGG